MRAVLFFRTLSHYQLVQRLLENRAARWQVSGQTVQMRHSAEFCRDLQHQILHSIKRFVRIVLTLSFGEICNLKVICVNKLFLFVKLCEFHYF